jgi:hypothetical protein
MISTPASRLPKVVSTTTLLLIAALLLRLLDLASSRREPARAQFPPFRGRSGSDSIIGWRSVEPSPARIILETQLDALAAPDLAKDN